LVKLLQVVHWVMKDPSNSPVVVLEAPMSAAWRRPKSTVDASCNPPSGWLGACAAA
jgi:hypothetical protein